MRARRLAALALLALGVAWAAPRPAAGQLFGRARVEPALVEFLDVGQGDSILIRSPEGKTALVDAGPSHDVVKLLRERNLKSIDLVVVTHHHSDHYGGMDAVIREFHPKYFVATDSSHTTPQYLRLLKLVRDSGMQVVRPGKAARKIELGSVTITIFPQPPEDARDENDNSIGLRVEHGKLAVLLTGDSEEVERRWWAAHCPELVRDCSILKLAHHGSRNGTDARWLELVKPRGAIASLGTGNDYGHPHKETVALLKRTGIPLFQTNLEGTITVHSDGRTWQVTSSGSSPRAPPSRERSARPTRPKADAREPAPDRAMRPASHRGTIVDLNHADEEELQALPGIGPVLARRIIAGRPYRRADDLRRVKGIGAQRLAELLPLVTAD